MIALQTNPVPSFLTEKFFEQLVYHFYASGEPTTLYSPHAMKDFAEKHAPGLFKLILNSILRDEKYPAVVKSRIII